MAGVLAPSIPESLPCLFVGLNTSVVLAIAGVIVGEFVGARKGVGFRILQANYTLDISGVFALLLGLSMMRLVLHALLKFIERRTVFWTAAAKNSH